MPLLHVEHLEVDFSRQRGIFGKRSNVRAVNDISFDVFESEVVSLVGESGSGKTTVARCIMQLVAPTRGSVRYNGKEVSGLRGRSLLDYRREVQLIFQDPFESLNPRHDVYRTVSTPIKHLTVEKDETKILGEVKRLLLEVGLNPEEVLPKLPHQLSGGERQRIGIARALASDPKLLIADEPLTMLDASLRLSILGLLMDLKKSRNLTLLIITHDLASAKVMSDRTAVMYLGRIVELGPTSKILSKPYHPYTSTILSATPRLQEAGAAKAQTLAIKEADVEPTEETTGCVYRPLCPYATEVCAQKEPQLLEKAKEHQAACHNPLV